MVDASSRAAAPSTDGDVEIGATQHVRGAGEKKATSETRRAVREAHPQRPRCPLQPASACFCCLRRRLDGGGDSVRGDEVARRATRRRPQHQRAIGRRDPAARSPLTPALMRGAALGIVHRGFRLYRGPTPPAPPESRFLQPQNPTPDS